MMKIHPNGGGKISETACAHEDAYVDETSVVLDNAHVGRDCEIKENSIVSGNAVVFDRSVVCENSVITGSAVISNCLIHSESRIEKTPAVINGFEQQIIISDDFIIVGCQRIDIAEWETRSLALLRANGFPKKSAERIRDAINSVRSCYISLYDPEEIKAQYIIS